MKLVTCGLLYGLKALFEFILYSILFAKSLTVDVRRSEPEVSLYGEVKYFMRIFHIMQIGTKALIRINRNQSDVFGKRLILYSIRLDRFSKSGDNSYAFLYTCV